MTRNSHLQFCGNGLETSEAGDASNIKPASKHSGLYERTEHMPDIGQYNDSVRLRNMNIPRTPWGDAMALRRDLEDDGWKTPNTYCKFFAPIPKGPGVYVLTVVETETFQRGFAAYVGMSNNLMLRLQNHNIIPLLERPGIHVMRWFKKVRPASLRETEASYIHRFDPPWNIAGKVRGVTLCV